MHAFLTPIFASELDSHNHCPRLGPVLSLLPTMQEQGLFCVLLWWYRAETAVMAVVRTEAFPGVPAAVVAALPAAAAAAVTTGKTGSLPLPPQ